MRARKRDCFPPYLTHIALEKHLCMYVQMTIGCDLFPTYWLSKLCASRHYCHIARNNFILTQCISKAAIVRILFYCNSNGKIRSYRLSHLSWSTIDRNLYRCELQLLRELCESTCTVQCAVLITCINWIFIHFSFPHATGHFPIFLSPTTCFPRYSSLLRDMFIIYSAYIKILPSPTLLFQSVSDFFKIMSAITFDLMLRLTHNI